MADAPPRVQWARVPARFWTLALACLAAVAALAVNRLSGRARAAVVVAVSLGFLVDGWPREFLVARAQEMRPSPPGIVHRVDLPFGDGDAMAMYQQTMHGTPTGEWIQWLLSAALLRTG